METRLASCPFCGKVVTGVYGENRMYVGTRHWRECEECGARGPKRKTPEDATEAWDARAPAPALAAAHERIVELEAEITRLREAAQYATRDDIPWEGWLGGGKRCSWCNQRTTAHRQGCCYAIIWEEEEADNVVTAALAGEGE